MCYPLPSPLLPPPSPPLVWYIESEPQAADTLPRTDVSFNNGRSATIDAGVLYVDSTPLANLSDIIALTDGVTAASVNGLLFEPGRLLYHWVEFCSLAHTCVTSDPLSSIVIRECTHTHTHTHLHSLFLSHDHRSQ